ncbi:caspase family protein [Nocardiopsis dassonvillei]|uniref:caspase family protein n=1 Tax=Nocardiopsis dassonvillei TaxID=2014 RepID=UPI000B9D64CF|nr:caspase family protein [Nocardiopsis dassonvillei]ASU60037.1 peptidase C14 caspase catalytic subunit p20 [Nocardiopsis dassonvillei]
MPSGTGRRFFLAVGVSRYQHLSREEQLTGVGEDVLAVRNLFTGFGYESVLEGIGDYGSANDIREKIRRWVADVELGEEDVVVLYFAGHGYAPDRDRHYLCCWDTREDTPASTALATEDLVRILCEGRLRRLLLILDTCAAGAGASDAAGIALNTLAYRLTGGDVSTSVCFLSSARAKDLAQDGAFAPALREAVETATERAGQRQPYLDLASVVQHVNDHFAENGVPQRAELAKGAGTGLDPFLPNDSYRADLPSEGTDLDFQRQAAELAEHYGPRSRGVEFESEQGRYFSGREWVLRDLVSWMTSPEGDGRGRIVTGKPGCGKSAVLGRVVTVSDREYRERLGLAESSDDTLVPVGTVTAAVHARHKRLEEIVERVFAALGSRARTPSAAGLLQELAQRARVSERPLVIVVDALDEAGSGSTADFVGRGEPRRIARELLRPMAEIPGVRLLVGTRRELVRALESVMTVIDLDTHPADTEADIRGYVRQVLLASDEADTRTPYRDRPELADRVARGVAGRAAGVFLVARLTARSLRKEPTPIDTSVSGWQRTLPSGVGEAFDDYLARFGEEEDRVRRLLTPLAFAEGQGLPRGSTWAAMAAGLSDAECSDADISEVLRFASDYVAEVVEGERSVYRLYHQALADHLRASYNGRGDATRAQERIVAALLGTVPGRLDGQGPDWFSASAYVRAHLATHASDTGHLDALVADPVFLLAAGQLPLMRVLGRVSGEEAQAARTAYEQVAHRLSERYPLKDRTSDLQLSARRCGADALAERIDKSGLPSTWTTRWAWWSTSGAHRQLVGHTKPVTCVATTALDGHRVAVTGSADKTVRLWDLSTQSQMGGPLELPVRPTCLAPGELGEYSVALVGGIDGHLRIVDLSTNRVLSEPWQAHTNFVTDVAVANFRGRTFALTSSQDGTARLWDLDTRSPLGRPLEAHRSSVRAAALAPVGERLIGVTGGADRKAYVWDLTGLLDDPSAEVSGDPFVAHTAEVTALFLMDTPDGPVALSGDQEGMLNRWNPLNRQQIGEPTLVHPHVMSDRSSIRSIDVGVSKGRKIVLTSAWGDARVCDLETMRQQGHPLRGHTLPLGGAVLICQEDETYAVTVSGDRTARVWDLAAEQPETGHVDVINDVAATTHEGRSYAVTGGAEGVLCVWDLDELRGVTRPLEGNHGAIRAVALASVDGDLVAVTGGDDTSLRVWRPLGGRECVRHLTGHTNAVTCLQLVELHGRPLVISGSEDGTIRLWDLSTGAEAVSPLTGQIGGIREMRALVDSGGLRLVARTTLDYLYLWSWKGGHDAPPERVVVREAWYEDLGRRTIGIGFFRGAPVAMITSGANDLRCYSVDRWEPVGSTIKGWGIALGTAILSSFTHDDHVAVVDGQGTIHLWRVESGSRVGAPLHSSENGPGEGVFVETAAGLGYLAVRYAQARLWDVRTTSAVGEAFSGLEHALYSACVNETGGVVWALGSDGTLRVHDAVTGRLSQPVLTSKEGASGLRRVSDTIHLVQRWQRMEVFDTSVREVVGSFHEKDLESYTEFAVHTLDGRTVVVTVGRDARLHVWDLERRTRVGEPLSGHTAQVYDLRTARIGDRDLLVSASADGTIRVWDLQTLELIAGPFGDDETRLYAADIADIGEHGILIGGSRKGFLYSWDPRDWSRTALPVPRLTDGIQSIRAVRVTGVPLIVAADLEGVIRVWNHATATMVGEIGVGNQINDLSVTPDGNLYAATDSGLVALRLNTDSLARP